MNGNIGKSPNIETDIRPRQPIQVLIPGKDQQIPIQNNNIHGGNIMDQPNKTSSIGLFDELNDIESIESLKVNEDDEDIEPNSATFVTPIKQNKDSAKVRDFFNTLDDPSLYFNQNGRSNLNAMLDYFNMNRTGRDSRKIYRDIAYRIGDL